MKKINNYCKKKVTKYKKAGKQKFTSFMKVDLMGIGPITISVLGRFASKEHVSPFIQILFYGFTQPRSGIPGLRVQFSAD